MENSVLAEIVRLELLSFALDLKVYFFVLY
jgi:hypothetical protein